MKKYIFMRVLRSLVSIFLVTTLTYTIIYTMVPRKLIFKQDTNYNKIATTADKRDNYENTVYEVMVGPWENLLKVANSTLLVKSRFLNVFSNSMLT